MRTRRAQSVLLIAVCLAGAAGCGADDRRARARASVRALGGSYSQGSPTYPAWTAEPRAVLGDARFAPLAGPPRYCRVDLWCKPAADDDVELLCALTDLTQLDISGTEVTDRALKSVGGLKRLTAIELVNTRVTDAGLVHLKGLTQLQRLRLDHCDITDAAIPHIAAIPSPEMYVNLRRTKVTVIRGGELRVRTERGGGDLRVGGALVVEGSYTVAAGDYVPDDIDIDVLGSQKGSDEATSDGRGTCKPVPRRGSPGVFDFRMELPAPKRPGSFVVEASTFARLHGFKGFYTAGVRRVRVLPPRDAPYRASRASEERPGVEAPPDARPRSDSARDAE